MKRSINRSFIHIMKYYKWYIILSIIISLIGVLIYLSYAPKIYKSYSIIEVKDDKNSLGKSDILLSALTGYGSSGVDKDIEILKTFEINKIILDKVDFKDSGYFNKYDIYKNVICNNLHVTRVKKNVPLIKLEFFDNNASRATNYVNILAETFVLQNKINKSARNNRIISFIDKELEEIKNNLKNSEANLKNYQESNKVINPSAQSKVLIHRLSDIELKLARNKLKREYIKNIIHLINSKRNIGSITPILKSLGDEPTLVLISKLQDIEIKIGELSTEYTYKHPKIIELLKQDKILRDKIFSNIKNIKWSIRNEARSLNNLKYKYEKELKSFPDKEKHLVNLKRDYEVNSKIYKYLLEKKSENEVLKVAITADYKVIERAYVPKEPVKPKNMVYIMVAFISSTLFGIFLALTRDKFNKNIRGEYDIETNSIIRFIYKIPNIKYKDRFIDSCKKISTSIELYKKNQSKVILITSIKDTQGKTVLTFGLSDIFKDIDNTLLIDLNIKNPSLHKIFKIDNTYGIKTYIKEPNKLYKIVKPTKFNSLNIIPMENSSSDDLLKLIFSDKLLTLLNKFKKLYKYIIIDASSIESTYEILNIMRYSDINIFVFKVEVSKKDDLEELNKIAKTHNLKDIIVVLNDTK